MLVNVAPFWLVTLPVIVPVFVNAPVLALSTVLVMVPAFVTVPVPAVLKFVAATEPVAAISVSPHLGLCRCQHC